MLRLVFCAAAFAVLALPAANAAQGGRRAQDRTAPAAEANAPASAAEWTEADYKAVRDRDDARHRAWDRKMKALTGSICTGC
jgi:hypothetical protein